MIETLIIPGLHGSPEGHWQHHWAENDPLAEIVEQESWSRPRFVDWLHALEARLEASQPGVVLVAHSLGCSLVAAIAERPAAAYVSGALLVAPADVQALADRHPEVGEFQAGHHTPLPFASLLVASRNDPFMDFASAQRQAATWGSAFYDLGDAGHINIASGYGAWKEAPILADGLRGRLVGAPLASFQRRPQMAVPSSRLERLNP